MSWRVAKALETLRGQLNAAAPGRSKASDGTIGDASHSSRASDHNPNPSGVVTALDITHDPRHGIDAGVIAGALQSDKRVKYLIWNRRIWKPVGGWKPYSGTNPHTGHLHISVLGTKAHYDDTKAWDWGHLAVKPAAPAIPPRPSAVDVKAALIRELSAEKGLGPLSIAVIKAFQAGHNLVVDGDAGPETWKKLGPARAAAPALRAGETLEK